jgi:hypothetical protein
MEASFDQNPVTPPADEMITVGLRLKVVSIVPSGTLFGSDRDQWRPFRLIYK